MYKKKTFREKLLDNKDFPKVVKLNGKAAEKWGEGTMVIARPGEVDEIMRKVPKGKLITINEIRNLLAHKHNTNMACPITTGIFARIAAGAAEEDLLEGKKRITPFWRTLKCDGEINPKYPGGVEKQIKLLESEGHTILPKGTKKFVVDQYKKFLVRL